VVGELPKLALNLFVVAKGSAGFGPSSVIRTPAFVDLGCAPLSLFFFLFII